MKILNLALENFRGIKAVKINFNGQNTDIFGANGLGKTTVANAICWLLIDRPATEEPDFDPKTTGAHGIHHTATMTLRLDDGQEMTVAKDFYEKWTRKKGSATSEFTGNVTDYYIDGAKAKKKEYTAAVERACGVCLDKMKMLLVLGYFTDTMTTEEKRKILFELADEFTDGDVFKKHENLRELTEYLKMPGASGKSYTIAQWKDIAAEQRRSLNKALELLPTRIDEAAKNAVDAEVEESSLADGLKNLEIVKEELENEIRTLGSQDRQQEQTRAAIAEMNVHLETKRAAHLKQSTETVRQIEKAIEQLADEKRGRVFSLDENERERQRQSSLCETMTAQRQQLIKEYGAVQKERWNAEDEICPTCGQTLPLDQVQELKAQFNQRKAEKKEAINLQGQSCSTARIEAATAKIAALEKTAEAIKKDIADIDKRIGNLRATPTEITPFESTQEYAEIIRQIDELKGSLAAGKNPETEKAIAEKKERLTQVKAQISESNLKLAGVRMAKQAKKRVAELEAETKETSARLERVERGIHLCEEFTRAKARMVTESINKHFRLVRFVLFRDQINGGLKEICEPTVKNRDDQWVEYRSVNFADRINAKLDVVDTLNRHYKSNLPVIMDQAESVTSPLPIEEQLIRLIVSSPDTGAFRVQNREKKE